jgi:hypothetical protein
VLADIAVPSAAARPAGTILTSDITDRRQYTTTTGGIIPVTNLAATTGLPIGTTYYDLANEQLGVIKAAGPRSPGGAPAVVQSAALNTSMWDVNWTDMRRLSQSLFSATFTRSGWAFVTAELDLQPDQNGWLAAYVRADIDGTPMVGSNRAAMYQNATTVDTQRRPYMLHVPTPVWFDAGVSRELCLAVSSFGTPPATTPGWWSPNTVQWTVAQV